MNEIITLISVIYETDMIGQKVKVETEKDIFCEITSISQSEWYEAGRNGLQPQYRAIIPDLEYGGEQYVKYNSVRYSVYRTYQTNDGTVELYLEQKAGM